MLLTTHTLPFNRCEREYPGSARGSAPCRLSGCVRARAQCYYVAVKLIWDQFVGSAKREEIDGSWPHCLAIHVVTRCLPPTSAPPFATSPP